MNCKKCGKWIPICKCDGSKGTNIQVFKPMIYKDLDVKPILIESKRQLREECKKRNLIAARLL